jgi:large subunit ribosomal protein L6
MKSNLGLRTVQIAESFRCSFLLGLHLYFTPYTHLLSLMASSLHCSRASRALGSVYSTSSTRDLILPAFLVPAFASSKQSAPFSSTSQCRSKIGRAPLSVPPEVTFTILETPPKKQSRGMIRTEPDRHVQIEGPLGKLSLEIPPFMSIASNEESRTRSLSILDANDKKQKAMWGESRAFADDRH